MLLSNKLKTVLLKDLKVYKNNVKVHSEDQIQRIKKSIEDNTYLQPICIYKDNEIVIGTGRYLALQLIDLKMEIEVVDLSELPIEKIKKLRIVDNQLSNLSTWDDENLALELKKIYTDLDTDYERILDEIGLAETEIDTLIRQELKSDKKPVDKNDGVIRHIYKCPKCGYECVKGES